MGLSVVVTDYTSKIFGRIDDPKNLLHKLLPPANEESNALLAKIDWYGDTYFNYLQLGRFIEEWNALEKSAKTDEELVLLREVSALAVRCRQERNLLRFIGD